MDIVIVLILVGFSALFSGMTLGFFSLNKDDLKRKMEIGDKNAIKIYPIRKNGNLLFCTLLIGNVAVNSTLAIYLGSIASGFTAGLIATSLIVIFGEIIPQASFSRYALVLGARFAWLVRIFIIILFPICWPLAWALDKILGEEIPTVYSKHELIKIVEGHEHMKESEIDSDEEKIIRGALSYSDKQAHDILTPRVEVFSLPSEQALDRKMLKKIYKTGHSRIPVYLDDRDNIVGILYSKDLIANDNNGKTVGDLARQDVIFVDYDKPLDQLLNAFKKTRHHLFVVLSEYGGMSGIVTIEDVLEEIIGEEIVDEFDKYENPQEEARKKMKMKKLNKI